MAEKTILDLTPIGQLAANDKLPIAREGLIEDNNTSIADIADYVVSSEAIQGKVSKAYVDQAIDTLDNAKVEKVNGKGLSTNDYTNAEKEKLGDLPTKAELDAEFAAVQDQLTFDDTPTAGSDNPVKSKGIKAAIDEKYSKPAGGIPATDLAEGIQDKIDHAMSYEPTTDPTEQEMQDEYQRILTPLYQALNDATVETGKAIRATDNANEATSNANSAAGTALNRATAADNAAAAANAAAAVAETAAEQGKGDYNSLADRLQAIESNKQNKIADIATIRTNASIAAALATRVATLESLIGDDADGVIDKFNEIVDFLAGIGDTQTLDAIIAGLSEAINAKYAKPAGGIPKTDLDGTVQASLGKADTAVQYENDGDPYDADTVNEYDRLLAKLYQALIDARTATDATNAAIANAYNAQGSAEAAALLATTKAGVAQTAADNADSKATEAHNAAENAQSIMDAAKGNYESLAARLTAMATAIAGKYNKPAGGIPKTDLSIAVATSLEKADSAYQLPYGGIPKTDMSASVQTSLGKADTAVQPAAIVGLIGYEVNDNPASLLV